MADDLVARLRAALDAEAQDIELSIANEIESLLADGGIVMTREEILALDAEEEGGGPYTRRLRMVAAHRKILDAWDANERELAANSAEFSRPAHPMEDEAERFRRLGNAKAQGWELQGRRWALRLALAGIAEGYGITA